MCSGKLSILTFILLVMMPPFSFGMIDIFLKIGCKGRYVSSQFSRLHRVCLDCYHLFREEEISEGCTKECFTHLQYFPSCIEALLLNDEKEKFQRYIKVAHSFPSLIFETKNNTDETENKTDLVEDREEGEEECEEESPNEPYIRDDSLEC